MLVHHRVTPQQYVASTHGGVCGRAVNTLDLEVRGSSLAGRIVSLDKELYSTLFLFTQVYKWVTGDIHH